MSSRYYSVPEVNAFLPRVREAFTRVMQLRAQLKPIYRRLEQVDAAPDRSDFEIDLPGAAPEVLRDRAAFKGMIEMLNDELGAIADLGGNVKDLDTGLVDWRALRYGEDILLCWRFGETEIAFWHDMEAGFAGRRPVAELVGTEAAPLAVATAVDDGDGDRPKPRP
jgi:hypothetical protein